MEDSTASDPELAIMMMEHLEKADAKNDSNTIDEMDRNMTETNRKIDETDFDIGPMDEIEQQAPEKSTKEYPSVQHRSNSLALTATMDM
jgi:hypothetical protein